MALTRSLEMYIKDKTRFDPSDILGKGRIRKLIYEYQDLKERSARKIDEQQTIMHAQAQSVTKLLGNLSALEDENKYLKSYIKESDVTKNSLLAKKVKAENLAQQYHEEALSLAEKNGTLVEKIAKLEQDYKELSEVHEKLLESIKNTPDPNQLEIEGIL